MVILFSAEGLISSRQIYEELQSMQQKVFFQYYPEIYLLTYIDSANVSTPSNATCEQYFKMPATRPDNLERLRHALL